MKNNVKKIIGCLILITMVMVVATKTFATENNILDKLLQDGNSSENINENENVQNIEEIPEEKNEVKNENKDLNVNASVNVSTNVNENENKPTTTPYTGIGDYSTMVFIIIFAISAIYAYKKVKDYNI